MLHAEDGKDERQKRGIARQANVGRGDFVRAAEAINSVLQPVLGNVTVDEGVGHNSWKAKNEKQPQQQSGRGKKQEKTQISANQFGHVGNISRL